jgi:opacity protein-like surface antigen
MKKIVFAITMFSILCLTRTETSAQAFSEGGHTISAGYGFVTFMGALKSSVEDNDENNNIKFKNFGPLYFKYEYGVAEHIGLGINFAYATNEISYNYDDIDDNGNDVVYKEVDTRKTYSILARVNFHFGDAEKFDPYLGVGLGYRDAKWTFESNDPDGFNADYKTLVKFGFETTVGVRYFFSDNFGLYGEVGGAKSIVQLGLCGKF